jgi:hypothetical protein
MVRSAIFSWALVLLLAGFGAHLLEFPGFGEQAIDLAFVIALVGLFVHVLWLAVDVLRHSRRSIP